MIENEETYILTFNFNCKEIVLPMKIDSTFNPNEVYIREKIIYACSFKDDLQIKNQTYLLSPINKISNISSTQYINV